MFLTTFTKSYISLLLLFLSQYVIRYDHYSYSYSLFDGLIKKVLQKYFYSLSLFNGLIKILNLFLMFQLFRKR
ncbi:HSPV207 [Horsepox virus]|uniref:HSPV001 n=1 Tax=Horsepox virus TaxID=397342 RepID=Q0GNL8_HSPV|nr:HSPV001 [Horsepox virus]ABH08323.1 HSPV207 [Horsepox virus]AUD55144.1 HSPV001 [Horsepox virus]AUD55379.1 HSPV207 [Horsepox virus]DAD53348.1 TPA_asm: hypothetical protein [Horsepox virus]